jgi:hypothetical protein
MGEVMLASGARTPPGTFSGPSPIDADRRDLGSREQLVRRVRREFEEMPGLRLTFQQARLLFGLDPGCCTRVLGSLTDSGFLMRTRNGLYGRRDLVS